MKFWIKTILLLCPWFAICQNQWTFHSQLKSANASFQFIDVTNGKSVFSYNPDALLNPASTIKLLSSLVYLEEKGDDFLYTTTLGYTGVIDQDGTLKGDLVFYSNGNPSFGSARYGSKNSMSSLFTSMVAYAQKLGINCVEGNIVVDASLFGTDCTPHTWQFNDLGNYYASGTWSTNVNENAYKLSFNRTSTVQLDKISPPIPNLYFKNELVLGPANSGDQAYIFCGPYQDQAFIRGSIPKGKGLFSIRGSIPNAPLFIGHRIKNYLESNAIKVSGSVEVEFENSITSQVFWENKGVPLKKQVKSAIEKSINLYCESFLLSYGKGNRDRGIKKLKTYLKEIKAIESFEEIIISDGSGLSQRNFIHTNAMSRYILHQYRSRNDLKDLLAQNGKDGTLKNAFTNKELLGKIYGKSGSMAGVRAYAGILKCQSGKELVFSVMINNYSCSSQIVYQEIERILLEVYRSN